VRASVIAGASGADNEAAAFEGGHPLCNAISPAGATTLRYAGDTQRVSLYDLADGAGGGGAARSPTVLSTTSGASRTPQWLPLPQRRAGTPQPLAAPITESEGELVLLLEDVADDGVDAGTVRRGARDRADGYAEAVDRVSLRGAMGATPHKIVLASATAPRRLRVFACFWGRAHSAVLSGGGRLCTIGTNPLSGREELEVMEWRFRPDERPTSAVTIASAVAASHRDAVLSNPETPAVECCMPPEGRRLPFLNTPRGGCGGGSSDGDIGEGGCDEGCRRGRCLGGSGRAQPDGGDAYGRARQGRGEDIQAAGTSDSSHRRRVTVWALPTSLHGAERRRWIDAHVGGGRTARRWWRWQRSRCGGGPPCLSQAGAGWSTARPTRTVGLFTGRLAALRRPSGVDSHPAAHAPAAPGGCGTHDQ